MVNFLQLQTTPFYKIRALVIDSTILCRCHGECVLSNLQTVLTFCAPSWHHTLQQAHLFMLHALGPQALQRGLPLSKVFYVHPCLLTCFNSEMLIYFHFTVSFFLRGTQ